MNDRIKEFERRADKAEGRKKEMYQRMIETFKKKRKMVEDMQQRQIPNLQPQLVPPAAKPADELQKQIDKQRQELQKQVEERRKQVQQDIEAIADDIERARRANGQ